MSDRSLSQALSKAFIPSMFSLKHVSDVEEEAPKKLESIAVLACDNIPMIHSDVEVIVDSIHMGEEFELPTLRNHAIVQASKFTMNELKATKKFHRLSCYSQRELEKDK